MSKLLGWLLTLFVLALFVVLVAVRPFWFDLVHMPAQTMLPTVATDSYVLVDKRGTGIASLADALWRYGPQRHVFARGDIVIVRVNEESILSRVIGVAGDKVQYYDNGTLKVNGEAVVQHPVDDAEAKAAGFEVREEVLAGRHWRVRFRPDASGVRTSGHGLVPAGSLYVLGDSRDEAADSRSFGPVPLADVLGVVLRVSTTSGARVPHAPPFTTGP